MTRDQTVEVTARCPECGAKNQLTLSRVADDQRVLCSRCGMPLGLVGDLVAAGRGSSPKDRTSA